MKRHRILDKIISKLPYISKQLQLLDGYGYEPGDYYSPIPDIEDIKKRKDTIFSKINVDLKGINLEKENQFRLLESFIEYYKEIPYNFKNIYQQKHVTRFLMHGIVILM